jgi:hypothetical protein
MRDPDSLIGAHAVFPPLTKTNLAGDPEIMPLIRNRADAIVNRTATDTYLRGGSPRR